MAACGKNGRTVSRIFSDLFSVFLLLLVGLVLAKKPTPQENLEKMINLREEHGTVISADDSIFKKHIKSKHSKYSVVTMFTALDPKFNCEVCPEAKDEFFILASSYAAMQSSSTSDVFFVMVDYNNAPDAFMTIGLTHAPEFIYFPATRKRNKKSDRLDTMRVGYDANGLAKFVAKVDGTQIAIKRPIDYSKFVGPSIVALVFVVILVAKPRLVLYLATSTTLWATVILFLVLAMTSGQMWNSIRNPRDAGRNQKGEIELVMTSDHGQFRYESYLVIALNAVISFGFILLNQATEVKHWFWKKVVGIIGLCMVVIFFSLLLSIFGMKNYGYPYSFLFIRS